jgi:hypothetical protein
VLRDLAANPYGAFILLWNWKAALFAASIRGPLFLLTTLAHGWRHASFAMLVEAAFRAGITGFLGAATQALRNARPRWLALTVMLAGFPLLSLLLDGLLHLAVHTPNLALGMLVSLLLSALASVFDWYIMRRGTMLVGPEGSSLWSDLKSLPALCGGFLLAPPIWIWRCTCNWLLSSGAD